MARKKSARVPKASKEPDDTARSGDQAPAGSGSARMTIAPGGSMPVAEFLDQSEMVALYGKKLAGIKTKIEGWRSKQVKHAFQIGDVWRELEREKKLSRKELTAFLAHECQVPRRDVARHVRLAEVLGDHQDFLAEEGVAVSVLLDLAAQPESVREEAFRMIRAGRSLQAKDLRSLRRDIGLAEMVRDDLPDPHRQNALVASAAKRARVAARTWLTMLQEVAEELQDFAYENGLVENQPLPQPFASRLERVSAKAQELRSQLPLLVEEGFLERKFSEIETEDKCSWSLVARALDRIACGDIFEVPGPGEWDRSRGYVPMSLDDSLYADLAWGFGYEWRFQPTPDFGDALRSVGRTPLDTVPDGERTSADVVHRPTVLEICAGAGGQALGLHEAGFQHLGLVEFQPDAAETLRINRPEWPVIEADLKDFDGSNFEGVDLLAGGVPCQPYSPAGERRGKEDERDLFPEALRLVRRLKPKAVMLENVTGLFDAKHSVYRLHMLSELASLGYDAEWRVLESAEFGLCQNRKRAILVGFRPGMMHRFRWPHPHRNRRRSALEQRQAVIPQRKTVGQALRDLMGAREWPHVDAWADELAVGYAPTLIGGSQRKLGIDLAQQKSRDTWVRIGINPNGKADNAPGPDAGPADLTMYNALPKPPDRADQETPAQKEARRIAVQSLPKLTLEMMARIQDFPDGWFFSGVELQRFHQIANAFPPTMARAMGYSIIRALSGSEVKLDAALSRPIVAKPESHRGLGIGKHRLAAPRLDPDLDSPEFRFSEEVVSGEAETP